MQPTDFKNLCPVRSNPLSKQGKKLTCADHYEISAAIHKKAWSAFEKSDMGKDAEKELMSALLDNNSALNKPTNLHHTLDEEVVN